MRLQLRAATPEALRWLAHYADCTLSPLAIGLAAVDSKGRTRGCVAYDEVANGACRVHQAAVPIAVRALVPAALVFPFQALGVSKLVGTVASHNAPSLRLATKLGFREVGRDEDVVHLELRREWCRFLPLKEAA